MSEIARLNVEAAKHDPAQFFASPKDIVGEVMLTRGEKIATLERWRLTILQQLAAADDGMRTQGFSRQQSDVLQDIEVARRTLASAKSDSQQ